jgi:hypothetical protein
VVLYFLPEMLYPDRNGDARAPPRGSPIGSWDDDDCWSDRDDVTAFQPIRACRPPAEEEAGPEPPEPLVSVEEAFVGAVYWIADTLWGIPDRLAHPGVCVRCDHKMQQAVMVKGTSVRQSQAWRYERYEVLVVDPTPENGLKNPTAFSLEPRPIDLRILRRIHLEDGPRGRVPQELLWTMEARLADLERALAEGKP